MRTRLVWVLSAALVYVLGVAGSSGARPVGYVQGITINAPLNVVEHNIGLWGFFTKPGVRCKDFKGAGVPNPAVTFGKLDVLSHPENGRAGCFVQAETIEFLKAGTIHFQIKLTETGAFTGKDTINDTAVVTKSATTPEVRQAELLVDQALAKEAAASAALARFKKTKHDADLKAAEQDLIAARLELKHARQLQLPAGPQEKLATTDIDIARTLDQEAMVDIERALKQPSTHLLQDAELKLQYADGRKRTALIHLHNM